MSNRLRISTFNGLLLALYFIPTWTSAALKIVIFPIRGLYDRANIGPAIFFTDHFHMFAAGTIRFAWLLAVAKLLVVAFFIVFAALSIAAAIRRSGDGDEALGVALVLGSLLSFASMIVAATVSETAAVHLHATETLMLLGGLVTVMFDRPRAAASSEALAEAHGI
jgi:hypothetical protein